MSDTEPAQSATSEFRVGNTVVLMSGGPRMTVRAVGPDKIWCDWFVGDELKQSRFTPSTLRRMLA